MLKRTMIIGIGQYGTYEVMCKNENEEKNGALNVSEKVDGKINLRYGFWTGHFADSEAREGEKCIDRQKMLASASPTNPIHIKAKLFNGFIISTTEKSLGEIKKDY